MLARVKRAVGLKKGDSSGSDDDEPEVLSGGQSLRKGTLHSRNQAPSSPKPPPLAVDGGPRRSFARDIASPRTRSPMPYSPLLGM
jgi:hypothetical protein